MPNSKEARKKAVTILNDVLTAELTAINQYFVHSQMCENWHYDRLHERIFKESIDEMKHAEELIERILYLGGIPNVQRLGKIQIGESIPEALKLDLEREAVPRLNEAVRQLQDLGDNGSRMLVEEILESEEDHIDWLEAQMDQMQQVGEQNYLAQQIKKDGD